MSFELPPQLLDQVRPDSFSRYLAASGWNRVVEPAEGRPVSVYRYPDVEYTEAWIPATVDLADYDRRLLEAFSVVASVENRRPIDVLGEVLLPASDILKFGLNGPETINGTVPLLDGIRFFESSKKALLAAAKNVEVPRQHYKTLQGGATDKFIKACQIGQTEVGSFVASFICPLDAVAQHDLFVEDPDVRFTRLVSLRLLSTVKHITTYIDEGLTERLIEPEEDDIVVSSNICDALVEMQPKSEDADLRITFSWSKTAPPPDITEPIAVVEERYFPAIRRIAEQLRPQHEPVEEFFVAKVESLHGKPNSSGDMQGKVVVTFQHGEAQIISAALILGPGDYEVACDAHKNGAYVAFHGTLYWRRRLHLIEDYRNFRIARENAT